jgi:hypothetical protein
LALVWLCLVWFWFWFGLVWFGFGFGLVWFWLWLWPNPNTDTLVATHSDYTQEKFCAPYWQPVNDGGILCETDADCRSTRQCYDTCRDCDSESTCDGRVFNGTIAPWGTKQCNSFNIYGKP